MRISKAFYAGKHEVTIGQALQWLNSGETIDDVWVTDGGDFSPVKKSVNRWLLNDGSKFGASAQQPMQCISWHGARAFCAWCSKQDAKYTYRLPTEAEWEYMARAGSKTAYPWGHSLNGKEANVNGNEPYGTATQGPYKEVTTAVGSYAANKWGLHDTVGNVYEWCEDAYDPDCYSTAAASQPDPANRGSSVSPRVSRGGSWVDSAVFARSAYRCYFTPGIRNDGYIGFRVVAE